MVKDDYWSCLGNLIELKLSWKVIQIIIFLWLLLLCRPFGLPVFNAKLDITPCFIIIWRCPLTCRDISKDYIKAWDNSKDCAKIIRPGPLFLRNLLRYLLMQEQSQNIIIIVRGKSIFALRISAEYQNTLDNKHKASVEFLNFVKSLVYKPSTLYSLYKEQRYLCKAQPSSPTQKRKRNFKD